jgi:nucleotide-binding universal stress UspA family protein
MNHLTNILLPIDFSEASLNALETAAAIAQLHGAKLQLLHVNDNSYDFLSSESHYTGSNIMPETSNDILIALATKIEKTNNIKTEVLLLEGNVSNAIVKTAWINNADLIVMGTHGASGYRDSFIGSNSYGVVKHAPCSVLTVPPNRMWQAFRKALMPIRPSKTALSPYPFVRKLIQSGGCTEVLNVATNRLDNQQKILDKIISETKKTFEGDQIKAASFDTEGKSPAQEVLQASEKLKSDLLILTPSVDAVNKQLYVGPHAQKILHCARIPVLHIKLVNIPAVF